jgi:RNA polymerase primary sigma factor
VVARRYVGYGLPLDELIAAGNLGLVEASLRFDPARKVKFITYADWWIRKAILEAMEEQTGPVRLPRYQHERLRALRTTRAELLSRDGGEPDKDDLAREAGLSRRETDLLLRFIPAAVSLEQPVRGQDGRPLREVLPDPDGESPQRSLVRRDLARRLRRQVASLAARETEVILLRFGLHGEPPLTLREAGRRLGISRERVRQLELRALLKLRRAL